jgi:predicted RNA methylase
MPRAAPGDNWRMSFFSGEPSSVEPGQIRRSELQGSVATYRVLEARGEVALMEVVEAPGLGAGMRFSFTLDAVGAMAVVADDVSPVRVSAGRFVRALPI